MKRAAAAVVIVCLPIVAGVALAMDNAHRSQPQTMSLLGNPRVMSKVAHRRAGSAEIFPFVSRTNGTATAIRIYVDRRNRSTKLFVGVYLYRNGRPGRRLRYGQLSRPRGGHWNSVKISRVGIRSGHRYGISVLGRSGSLYFRYRTGNRCRGAQADQLSVKTLPASWGAAHQHSACAISAYVVGKREPSADPTTLPPAGTPVGSPAPSGAPAAVVGSAGEPATACSTTLNPGANVQGALAAAAAGGVVCLNAGNWTAQTLTGLSPASPGVTLAAAPGAIGQVNMAGITTTGTVNNLTVEGINFSDTFAVHAGANNIALKYSDFQHFPDYAIELCAGCVNGGPSIDNVTMSYNQIDYTAYCLRVASDGGTTRSATMSADRGSARAAIATTTTSKPRTTTTSRSTTTRSKDRRTPPPSPTALTSMSRISAATTCSSTTTFSGAPTPWPISALGRRLHRLTVARRTTTSSSRPRALTRIRCGSTTRTAPQM